MNTVPATAIAPTAFVPTPALDEMLAEQYDHIDPTTGRILWSLNGFDLMDYETLLADEEEAAYWATLEVRA